MDKKLKIQLPWLIWLGIISTISLLPGDQLPEIKFDWFEIDTVVHVIMYFGLVFLMFIGFYHIKNELFSRQVVSIIAIGIVIGFVIELIQGNVIENRFFSWGDVIANCVGVFTALLAFLLYRKKDINLVKFLQ